VPETLHITDAIHNQERDLQRQKLDKELEVLLGRFPAEERQEAIKQALAKIDAKERKQARLAAFAELSAEDQDKALKAVGFENTNGPGRIFPGPLGPPYP
jgi:ribosome recycling factor